MLVSIPLHPTLREVTERVEARSQATRAEYVDKIAQWRDRGPARARMSCSNLAHVFAASTPADKLTQRTEQGVNLGIVTAYNDMLSAHQPFETYPEIIRAQARRLGAAAQVAGGVPAMCDGVTQGMAGMELSLFSRDNIAMGTAIALSHDAFEAALCLGVCDKIVPGLVMGALSFGHLPVIFVPAGPMESGLPNKEKARIRALFAEGKASRDELLQAESQSYHNAGTCTFYGTANSNQMLMEMMGLHVPGAAFVNPGTDLRLALTQYATRRAIETARERNASAAQPGSEASAPRAPVMADVVSVRSILNAVIGLLATGGSTNHTLHLVAMARAAGIVIDWDDFAELSAIIPLLCRIYPNGSADVNHFHAAGGMGFLIRELLDAGLMHNDVATIMGSSGGMRDYTREPALQDGNIVWRDAPSQSGDLDVLRPVSAPFSADGGIRLLRGNLGRSVIKVSAVAATHRMVEAPAIIFHGQESFLSAFKAGQLERDFVAVLRFQGPRANGMPELHKLSPQLGLLQDRGFKVALVTDGRMSGASGKTPAAIHLTPEALGGGPIARLVDGDIIRLDAEAGTLDVLISQAELAARPIVKHQQQGHGLGRELFAPFRQLVGAAEAGASIFFGAEPA